MAPARAEERIARFVSDVDVQRNGDLLVTETIQIWAEGHQIKRGILRDFPTTYHRTDGSRVEVGFDVQSVTRDGSVEEFATEKMANGVRVRIGSAGRSVNPGLHDYVIRYRTTRQIGFFDSYDELYWNATGNGWTFPIDVAEARITLPDKVEFKQTAFYTGPQGAHRQGRHHRRAAARPHRVPHHAADAGRQRTDRCGRLSQGRGAAADADAAVPIDAAGRSGAAHRGDRRRRGRSCSICWRGCWSAAIRAAAPSFRCSRRQPACRPRRCASSRT